MSSAVILHGRCDPAEFYSDRYPSLSNSHWIPWLQKQLLMRDIHTETPEMPGACRPDYDEWRRHLERYEIGANSLLVGHSCGAGFLLRWLSENKAPVARTVLIAPWLDPQKAGCVPGFFDFDIDRDLLSRTELHVLFSDNDMPEVSQSLGTVRQALPGASYHLFAGYGHFCQADMGTTAFPELLAIVLGGTEGEGRL